MEILGFCPRGRALDLEPCSRGMSFDLTPKLQIGNLSSAYQNPEKVLVEFDSKTVALEVGSR